MAKAKKRKTKGTPRQLPRKGPYLSAALIAEKILTEQDKAITIVRVVDRVGISPESINDLKDNKLGLGFLTIVLSFKAGGYEGRSGLLIIQGGPSGNSEPLGMAEIPFDGTLGSGYNIFCPVALRWEKDGHYWFDTYLDNQFVTRIPLEVYLTTPTSKKE